MIDFHFHLEEGPYSIGWLQRTTRALANMHHHSMIGTPNNMRLPRDVNNAEWMDQLTKMLRKRIDNGCFDIEWLSLYLQSSQQQGIRHVGIVDHLYRFYEFRPYYEKHITLDDTPLGRAQQYWLDRVCVSSIESYLAVVREAQDRGFPISLGVEADYFPNGEEELAELLNRYEFDYIIGSVHFLDGWGFDNPDLVDRYDDKDLIELYRQLFDCVKGAALSGLFDIIAHLDNLKAFNHRPDEHLLLPMYEEVAETLKKADVGTELNTGLSYRYPVKEMCPSPTFLQILCDYDVPLTLASDAHFPDDLGKNLDKAQELLLNTGYKEIFYIDKHQRKSVSLIDRK